MEEADVRPVTIKTADTGLAEGQVSGVLTEGVCRFVGIWAALPRGGDISGEARGRVETAVGSVCGSPSLDSPLYSNFFREIC